MRKQRSPLGAIVVLATLVSLVFVAAATAARTGGASATSAVAGIETPLNGQWSFASDTGQHPPSLWVTALATPAPGDLFEAPIRNTAAGGSFVGQRGPEILDGRGNPIWAYGTGTQSSTSFRAQTYQGQPVLTWWQGKISPYGVGSGVDEIVDNHYRPVATIKAGNGFSADLHEILLSKYGTAYITAAKTVDLNLSAYHGRSNAPVMDNAIQEINIKTGKVVWQWDALKHIGLGESYEPIGNPWDPYHLNSVSLDYHGNVLISARNTWGVYEVKKKTGQIEWRLGGKRSNFRMLSGAHFAWQHDAQDLGGTWISVFDDEASPAEAVQSRGIVLWLDTGKHTAQLKRQYTHANPALLTGSQGNVQSLSNGDVMVGWGQQGYVSEYSKAGALEFDSHFHGPDQTYRSYREGWMGFPTYPPKIAVRACTPTTCQSGQRYIVYASWNGATQAAYWVLMAGSNGSVTNPSGFIARTGFETPIFTTSAGPCFAVAAYGPSFRAQGGGTSPTVCAQ